MNNSYYFILQNEVFFPIFDQDSLPHGIVEIPDNAFDFFGWVPRLLGHFLPRRVFLLHEVEPSERHPHLSVILRIQVQSPAQRVSCAIKLAH
jgi:hypothetical protein